MIGLRLLASTGAVVALAVTPTAVLAQTFTFERAFPADTSSSLDVSTERGKITVRAGTGADIVVTGRVTVRLGWDVPADAVALARAAAAQPPVEQAGTVVRLHRPDDARTRDAVTIAYEVQVPPHVRVTTTSGSGETRVAGIAAPVSVTTQSGAIELSDLADVQVDSGSGSVAIDGAGPLRVSTASSGITIRRARGEVVVRTQSGRVQVAFVEPGQADIETGSSAITVERLDGGLTASTESGKVVLSGTPRRPWTVTTGSSAIEVEIAGEAMLDLEASSGSGSVKTENFMVRGETGPRRVAGTIGAGGPRVHLSSRSGSITVKSAR